MEGYEIYFMFFADDEPVASRVGAEL